jgi:Family of unknown function (DUF6600)/FecR protein
MKIVKVILLVLAVLLLPRYADALDLGSVRISFLEGDVQMRTTEAGDWVPAAVNTPLDEGDELWVPEGGRMEFQLNTGTSVRLDQNSALQILTLERTSSQFYLSEGHMYVDYNAPRGNVIQFDTPVSSLRSYDRSVFRVDVPDQFTDVSVFRGWVDAEGRDGNTRVNAGRTLTLGGREAELAPIGRPDDWQNWNTERDRRFASRGDSYRYLPEELRVYSSDLDDSGRWVQVPEYGYVWTPRSVSTDWAPYRTGRWMWRGGDYVWVGSEPWGWTPYHYGRWAHAPRIGWFWVPPQRREVYWGPGYVGWVRTRDHVAWVPLAPREVYYGYGNYGPNSVDIRKRNIREINITKITYRNVQVNNSVTVINNNTFVTGRREAVNVRENPFLTEKINIGRPDMKPERASFAPVVKTIEPARLPPQQVNRIAVKELKQERRLVKEQNQSVINKGEAVKNLAVKAVEQPKSPAEKVQERRQTQLEKGKTGAAVESPREKAEEKSASPTEPSETKETKGRRQSSPEQAIKQPESAREKVQERQQTQMEKGKSGAPVESPRVKGEEKSASPSVATETKETKGRKSPAPVSETKPESTVEPRDRKSTRAEEKATTPIKPPEVVERKSARQLGPDEKEKPVPGPAKAPEARGETKDGKQTVAEKKESREEKKAKKEELDSKGKSTETKEEKIERKQKTLD